MEDTMERLSKLDDVTARKHRRRILHNLPHDNIAAKWLYRHPEDL
jgi:hypothetical protein